MRGGPGRSPTRQGLHDPHIRSDDLSFNHLTCRVPPFPFGGARAGLPQRTVSERSQCPSIMILRQDRSTFGSLPGFSFLLDGINSALDRSGGAAVATWAWHELLAGQAGDGLPSVLGGGARHSVTFRTADPGACGAGPVSPGDRPYRRRSPWLAHTHHVQPRRALTLCVPGSPIPAEKPGSCVCCPWNYLRFSTGDFAHR